MIDPTENIRREQVKDINEQVFSEDPATERDRLEQIHGVGNVWDTDQLQEKFKVCGFMAPYVVVTDRVTGKRGSIQFQHHPRFYFNSVEDK